MNKRQTMAIAVVIAIGVVLGALILTLDKMPSTSANTAREMPETKDKPRGSSDTELQPDTVPVEGSQGREAVYERWLRRRGHHL